MRSRLSFLSFCCLVFLVSCGGSDAAPVASAGSTQDIDVSALVTLDGSASTGSSLTYAWTQTSGTTVTLSDATAAQPTFTAGTTPQTYTFSLVVSRGATSSTASTFNIRVWNDASARIFVVPSSSSETEPDGSIENPYTDLENALTAAATTGADIYVAAGTHNDAVGAGNIAMVEGVNLYGGYESSNWTRAVTTNVSIIAGPTTGYTVTFGTGLTTATIIDGFTIYGGSDSSNGVAISIEDNGGGTISNNTIYTGEPSGASNSIGAIGCETSASSFTASENTFLVQDVTDNSEVLILVKLGGTCTATLSDNTFTGLSSGTNIDGGVEMIRVGESATATIQGNTMDAGVASAGGTGIKVQDSTTATIKQNSINAGSSANSTGVAGGIGINVSAQEDGDSPTVTIENNLIEGGSGYAASGALADNVGIVLITEAGAEVDIVNNTIYVGTDTTGANPEFGLFNGGTGTFNVVNNYFIQNGTATSQTAIARVDLTVPGVMTVVSAPFATLFNNAFYNDGQFAHYSRNNMGTITNHDSLAAAVAAITAEGSTVSGNIDANLSLVSGSLHQIASDSDLIDAGYAGAVVTVPTVDIDGNTRDATPDIGASEYLAP